MRFYALIALMALAGCQPSAKNDSGQDSTALPPSDVAAVRGESAPNDTGVHNALTDSVARGVATMNKAQTVTDQANSLSAQQAKQADAQGQ